MLDMMEISQENVKGALSECKKGIVLILAFKLVLDTPQRIENILSFKLYSLSIWDSIC